MVRTRTKDEGFPIDRRIIIAIVVALALLLVAFGRPAEQPDKGNIFRAVVLSPPDSLDPGQSYQTVAWRTFVNVYGGLLTFKKAEGAEGSQLVPDLAEAMPTLSDGGKTLTFRMRRGVKFSPPTNREVLPSDIKASIERLYKLPSPGVGFYLTIEGAQEFMDKKAEEVVGIVCDDEARTIQFRLTRPDATMLYKLALPFAMAVPKDTPPKDQTTAKTFPSSTGPYMFVKYLVNRQIVIKRNPNFKQYSPDVPRGHVDGMEIHIGVSPDNAVTKIKRGDADYMFDPVPKSKVTLLLNDDQLKDQLSEEQMANTAFLFMNTQIPPFNNVKVRQAVNWALDRRALVKLAGGQMTPGENILPPSMPGYKKHNFYPGPDLAKARQLIRESGVTPGPINYWCRANPETNTTSQYIQKVLTDLGFKPTLKCIDPSQYFTMVGNVRTKAQIGAFAWNQDFPEGSNFIDVLLNGDRITPEHNNNLAQFDELVDEINAANALLDQDERNKAWSELDAKIMRDHAPWAIYGHTKTITFTSERVSGKVFSPVYETLFMMIRLDGKGEEAGAQGAAEETAATAEVAP